MVKILKKSKVKIGGNEMKWECEVHFFDNDWMTKDLVADKIENGDSNE